jgi:pimeloyl-ACP methyl ester carboxylesterase
MRRNPAIRPALVLLGLLCSPVLGRAQGPPSLAGHWEGNIEIPGEPLGVRIDLRLQEGVWTGTIDIPLQSAFGLPLEEIQVQEGGVTFRIAGVPGRPTFEGTFQDTVITGLFSQSGMSFPFRLGRGPITRPRRPQEPEPPLPYREEECSVTHDGVRLAGTLTRPPGEARHPAVVLISGSGAQDRDETVFGHRPFLVLADFLTRAGIAVLRNDDRGVGGSTGDIGSATSTDFATDALAWVDWLAGRPDIDPDRIGLIGHSEGGIVAPLAAVRSDRVAFIVMMAGTGVPGDQVMLEQTAALTRTAGLSEEFVQRQRAAQQELFERLAAGAPLDQVRTALRQLILVQLSTMPESAEKEQQVAAVLERELRNVQTPWMRHFLTYDPRETLRRVRVPVLVLNGELDLQVLPDQNLPEIERALAEGGNTAVTVRRFPGLNHLFQPARTGLPAEYGSIETTLAPVVLETIRDWIRDRFPAPPASPLAGTPPDPIDAAFALPEKTVATWLERLQAGDREGAAACLWPTGTEPGLPVPLPLGSWGIERQERYGPTQAADWNARDIIPPAREGDVEITLRMRLRGQEQLLAVLLRETGNGWHIIARTPLGIPPAGTYGHRRTS